MSECTSNKPVIADCVAACRKYRDCFLDEIDRLIDWKPIEKVLRQKLKRGANAVGNLVYPPLLMFKILLLQRWHTLNDMAVEEALCDRLPFVRFVGLSLDHDEVPDATTICRFRQSLVVRTILKRLLDKLNHQLERQELLVREGIIVDASVVSSACRPLKVLDVLPEDREENSDDAPDVIINYSDDADAAWLRKGNRAYYGYNIHATTNSRDGFVLGGHATPANRSMGYSSQLNRYVFQVLGLSGGIMHKAARNPELTPAERAANRQVSSVRLKMERAFGTIKRGYGFFRARYLGLAKVELEFLLYAMAFNLKKAVLRVES